MWQRYLGLLLVVVVVRATSTTGTGFAENNTTKKVDDVGSAAATLPLRVMMTRTLTGSPYHCHDWRENWDHNGHVDKLSFFTFSCLPPRL